MQAKGLRVNNEIKALIFTFFFESPCIQGQSNMIMITGHKVKKTWISKMCKVPVARSTKYPVMLSFGYLKGV